MINKKLYFVNRSVFLFFLKKNKSTILFAYCYYKNQYYSILFSHRFNLNLQLNCIIKLKYSSFLYNKDVFSTVISFLEKIQNFNYIKWNFVGKGFKLKKNQYASIFNFNNSHLKVLLEKKIHVLKLQKNIFISLTNQKYALKFLYKFFLSLFKINIFTKRGIRIASSKILQKKIKKK